MTQDAPRVARSVQRARNPLQGMTKLCAHCRDRFQPARTTARYCTAKCRVAAWRVRQGGEHGAG